MKKALSLTAILLATAFGLISTTGCAALVTGSGTTYSNADKYTPGNIEITDTISEVNICWTSGTMELTYHDADTVSVKETCKVELSEDKQVHTWVDGETLWVQFAESGAELLSNESDKHLEVELPKDVPLNAVTFSGSSCDYTIYGIEAGSMSASSSSGDGKLTGCTAKNITANSSSGEIEITQTGESESIRADSSSGRITINAEEAGDIRADASSGEIDISVTKADKINADASSGDITITAQEMPSDLRADTSSGDVIIYLPENADFTAEIDTSSGDLDSDIALSKKGSSYIAGSGDNSVKVDTSSGNITIKAA
ncbi:MAG: DUF4097 family beta strand repeat protein [Ruminococcus sp.]|nr:DUF4097 family beta strand repeat protein [Ruminococcus sp.]